MLDSFSPNAVSKFSLLSFVTFRLLFLPPLFLHNCDSNSIWNRFQLPSPLHPASFPFRLPAQKLSKNSAAAPDKELSAASITMPIPEALPGFVQSRHDHTPLVLRW